MNEVLAKMNERYERYFKTWNEMLDQAQEARENGNMSRHDRLLVMAAEYQGRLNEIGQIKYDMEQAGIL